MIKLQNYFAKNAKIKLKSSQSNDFQPA